MPGNQLDEVTEALENRSVGIQNYIQGIGCFDLTFAHSLNKNFKSVMCKVSQCVAVCEDLKNKLKAIKDDEPHYYDLEECLREFEIPIPTISNIQPSLKSTPEVELKQDNTPVGNSDDTVPENEDEEEEVRFALGNSEFESIPKYMRGRMLAKDINEVLVVMNDLLIHKRDLLNKPFRSLNPKDKDLVVKWREGQNTKTGSALFLRELELKEKLNEKQRLNLRNVLPCLRHVKRVREVRDKGQLILYPLWM